MVEGRGCEKSRKKERKDGKGVEGGGRGEGEEGANRCERRGVKDGDHRGMRRCKSKRKNEEDEC